MRMSEDGGEGRSQSSRVGEEFLDGFYSYHRFLGFWAMTLIGDMTDVG